MPRILVSDEHGVYRTGLRILVKTRIMDAEVVEASSHIEGFSRIRYDEVFDLGLMDLNLSGVSSLNALKTACEFYPATRFVIMSFSDSHEEILACLAAGFHGFISKHQSDDEIVSAIRDILSGRIYVPWSLAEANDPAPLSDRESGGSLPMIFTEDDASKLTPRQREVLFLLAGGASNKEIARELQIAEATTKIHMAALLRALGVRNRTEAAFKAVNIINLIGSAPPLRARRGIIESSPGARCISRREFGHGNRAVISERALSSNAPAPSTDPEDTRILRMPVTAI